MFWAIYLNELKKNLNGVAFYIFTAMVFLATFLFISSTERGTTFLLVSITKEWHNAPLIIAKMLDGFTLAGILFTMVMVGRTVAKDFSAKIHDFFFTTPITKFQYLGGRFLGGLTANLLIFTGVFLGFILAPLRLTDPQCFGTFSLSAHILPTLFIVIPNLLFIGSIFFSVATLTRNMVITYIAGVALFMAYAFSSIALMNLQNDTIKILVDPFGVAALNTLTKFWTISDINVNSIPLGSMFILNRIIWLAVTFGVMIFTLKKFQFVSVLESKKKSKDVEERLSEARTVYVLEKIKPVVIEMSFASHMTKFWNLVGKEFKRIFFHPAFLILTFMAMMQMLTNFVGNVTEKGYEFYPFTSIFVNMTENIWMFMVPLAIFFSGVLVWRERDNNSHEFYDTLPMPDGMGFAAKLTTLLSLQFAYILIAMLCGVITQVVFLKFYDIQLGLYIKGMFGIEFMKYFFMAVIFMFIQNLVPNKYLGFFISAAYFFGDLIIFSVIKYENLLLRYGHIPKYIYSNLNGYGHFAPMIIWYIIYWLLFASILILLTALLWRRSNETHLKYRIKWALQRIKPAQTITLIVLLVAFLSTGFYIHYNRNVLNKYVSKKDTKKLQADYEKKFGKYERVPQPRATHVNFNIDIYPEKRDVFIKGDYLMKNKTDSIINEIYINLSDFAITKINKLEFTPKANLISTAEEFGFRIYQLEKPLNQGDEIKLDFDLEACIKGFSDNNPNNEIAANGTCIMYSGWDNHKYFPGIGFNDMLILKDKADRKKYGLPDRPQAPVLEKADSTMPYINSSIVTYNAVISTNKDQVVVSNGDLIKQWNENNRNYFHFKSDKPIHDEFIISSGRYEVAKDEHNGIKLEVYYDKKHAYNIKNMMNGLKAGLDFNQTYSPYPYDILRIVEVPDYMEEGGARSQPTVFIWKESAGFVRNLQDPKTLDYVFGIAAHELGHQWWAYIVNPAWAEGTFVTTETMCQYVWEMCFEKQYGKKLTREYLKDEMEKYLKRRKKDIVGERPLLRSYEGQDYIGYPKSSVVMYALQDYIGEDKVAQALKNVVDKFGWREDIFATANDLVNQFKTAAPDSLKYLVTDLFEKITLYENETKSATYQKLPDGKYKVSLEFAVHKFYADSIGNQTEAPLNDYIYVGVLGENGEELYLQKHKFSITEGKIEIIVDKKPAKAGIDPYVILIDRKREDNLVKVKEL